ncbi:MAG: hypothetical protein MK132_05090 [Lentisphaerales bacterium]|nr:hypothetical protein [Lentisphaerales bacterium]
MNGIFEIILIPLMGAVIIAALSSKFKVSKRWLYAVFPLTAFVLAFSKASEIAEVGVIHHL